MNLFYFRAFCISMASLFLAGMAGRATWDTQSSDRPILERHLVILKTSR